MDAEGLKPSGASAPCGFKSHPGHWKHWISGHEVRVKGGGMNHRLFCVLERDADDLGGSSIVAIDGLSKPRRSAADQRDYRRALQHRAEFARRRTVLE